MIPARLIKPTGYIIAACALIVAVFWWGYGKGYGRAEDRYLAEKAAALEAQKAELVEAHSRQLSALRSKTRGEDEARRIREAPRPDYPLCDAGVDWLHHIQGSVRIANGAAGVD